MRSDELIARFESCFGVRPMVEASAPGRVNLIGEHIDYVGGKVLPFAIPQRIFAIAAPSETGQVEVRSEALGAAASFPVGIEKPSTPASWINYVEGMVAQLRGLGVAIGGAKILVGGDLPPGSGLSSSAALCTAVGHAVAALAGKSLSPVQMAKAGQAAEHTFAGMPCGIMDQYASGHGKAEHAMLIDCAKLEHEYVPFHAKEISVLAIPSGVKHALADGAYEKRVVSCRKALEAIARKIPQITSLHLVTPELLESCRGDLDEETYRRARHVVSEVQRVERAVAALKADRFEELGQLLNQTQDSLRDDYEVSCEEVDELVALLRPPRVLGARMTGGGFGGVVMALLRTADVPAVEALVREGYYRPHGFDLAMFRVQPSAGASARRLS
jgi:galactokinase